MTDDAELLCRYADENSEEAFAALVRRHVDLVYSSALRQTFGDHFRAQEVTQMVFIDLARKARALARHPVLPAWLHRSSHFAALELHRKEARRRKYEHAAGAEPVSTGDEIENFAWEKVRPVLDEAIDRLDERDREAILLRFFSNHSYAEIGRRLELSENASRMRVERALEKLHTLLEQRGVASSATALAIALPGNAVAAAPAGVAAASTSAAMAAGGAAGVGALVFMSTAKIPLALTGAILLGGAAVLGWHDQMAQMTATETADLGRQNQSITSLREENERLAAASDQARNLSEAAAALGALKGQVNDAEAKLSSKVARPVSRRTARIDASQPVLSLSKLDQLPAVVAQHRPEYPSIMRQAGTSGQAVVQFVVGSDGLVYNASVISSTDQSFADAAIDAVSQWVFKPGQVGGQNVYTQMQVPIVFTLSQDPAPQPGAKSWF